MTGNLRSAPNARLSLDEHDDDLIIFATYLVKALHTMFPAVADDTLSAVNGLTAPPPAAIARSLLNDLMDVEQDFILVLDDYHFIRNQAIHDPLTEVVRHPPRKLHLVQVQETYSGIIWRTYVLSPDSTAV